MTAPPGTSAIPEGATGRDLIPGDVEQLCNLVALLRAYAGAFADARAQVQKVDAAEWQGTSAIGFRKAVRTLPEQLESGNEKFARAANALTSYAEALQEAQQRARAVAEDAGSARSQSRRYQAQVEDYNAAVERGDDSLPDRPAESDPGGAAMQDCMDRLAKLRADVADAGAAAARTLAEAAEAAPDEPGMLDQFLSGGQNLLQGVYEGVKGIVDLGASELPMTLASAVDGVIYGAQHPTEFLKAVADWETFKESPARWVGKLVPDLALTLVTGGAGAAARASKALKAVERMPGGRRKGREDSDADPDKSSRENGDKTGAGEPVDIATGEMYLTQTDLTLPGSLPLVLERTHISSYGAGGWFGPSWAATLDQHLEADDRGVVFAAADGMLLAYPVPEPGVPVLPDRGPRRPLIWDGQPGGPLSITDPMTGRVLTFAPLPGPDGSWMPLRCISDRNGHRITILYDEERHVPVEIQHSGGYRIAVATHAEMPRITGLSLIDSEHTEALATPVTTYDYDESGCLTEVANSTGQALTYTYDDSGRITSWTDRTGTSFGYVYDHRDRVLRTLGADGMLTGRFHYDEQSRTTTYTDSLGHTSRYEYSEHYKLVRQTNPLGNTRTQKWDPTGQHLVAATDPLGHTTRYAYDEHGNLATVHLPDGTQATATHNDLRLPVEVTEPGGATWCHTYDERGNRTSLTDPSGAVTRYAYDEHGHLTAITDALGHTRRIQSNPAGLPVADTDPLGNTSTARRDAFGRITELTDPLGHTIRHGWTVEGKPAWRELPDGSRESWVWDGEGNLTEHTDRAGHTTRYTATHFGSPSSRTDPDGSVHTFTHDNELRLTSVTNPQGLTWTYTYDPAGSLTAETDFNGRTLTYTHDAAGRLTSRTNGVGQRIELTRDVMGRTLRRQTPDGTTDLSYDRAGRLIRAVRAEAELTLTYNVRGQATSESLNGRTIAYAYDALGQRTSRITPAGRTATWSYDAAGRPSAVHADGHALEFGYDASGRETARRIDSDVTLAQEWNEASRLTSQELTAHTGGPKAARTLLQHRAYAYREDGYLAEIRDLRSGTPRFDLDVTGRVTTVHAQTWTENYAYDTTGNLSHATTSRPDHPADGEREHSGTLIRRAGRTSYEHDQQGRVVRTTRKLLNGQRPTWTYAWDTEDRLTLVTTPTGERWRYHYDPLGRRIAKARLAADSETVVEQVDFTWDGTRLAEQEANGTVTTWDYAPGTHRPLHPDDHLRLAA